MRKMIASFEKWLHSRLQPEYLRLLAVGIILVGIVLGILCFSTADQGTSQVGIPWGADFAGFYVAGQILDGYSPERLYDRALHNELYHRLLPKLPKEDAIPYVHPPFVAGSLRLLTKLPYDVAVLIWMVITLVLYSSGVLLMLSTCPELNTNHRWLVLLLALSFEPFLFECLLGGQLSAVGFFSFALCYYYLKQSKPLYAGLALGLCFYKPTLLLLMLPMLLIGRQWTMLAGMTVTGVVYLSLSLLMVGWDCTFSYANVLLNFRQQSSGAEEFAIRLWKYVDINHFWQMLLGNRVGKMAPWGIISLAVMIPVVGLFWWRNRGLPSDRLWAGSLFLVPVVNLYFGIYDTVIVVQAAIIMTAMTIRMNHGKLLGTRWEYLLLVLAIVPWFTQPLAKSVGVQAITVALLLCGFLVAKYDRCFVGHAVRASTG
jgi:hypothetical protein